MVDFDTSGSLAHSSPRESHKHVSHSSDICSPGKLGCTGARRGRLVSSFIQVAIRYWSVAARCSWLRGNCSFTLVWGLAVAAAEGCPGLAGCATGDGLGNERSHGTIFWADFPCSSCGRVQNEESEPTFDSQTSDQ